MKASVIKKFAVAAALFFCNCAGNKTAVGDSSAAASPALSSSPEAALLTSAPGSESQGAEGTVSESPVSFLEAIELSVERIAGRLSAGSRVAIVAFGAEHDNISEFIMEELSAALFNGGMMVTERESMEYVKMELLFQMSGEFDDSSIVGIGNLLGADMTVSGNLFDLGDMYRYQINAIDNRTGSRAASANITVRNDDAMKRTIAALSAQTRRVRVAKDLAALSAARTPETVGGFIDRGVAYAARNDFDSAIADFESALRMDPDNAAAKSHIEKLRAKRGR